MGRALLRSFSVGLLGLTAAVAVTTAHAATLNAVQGGVFVNSGNGYNAVGGTTELSPGDQVMANAGGSAQIVYPDGCKVALEPGSVVAIAPKSPCSIETGSVPDASSGSGIDGTTLLVGGLVVGGAVAAAVALSGDDDNDNGNGNGNGGGDGDGGGGGLPPASP